MQCAKYVILTRSLLCPVASVFFSSRHSAISLCWPLLSLLFTFGLSILTMRGRCVALSGFILLGVP